MGNLLGEPFKDYVNNQIKARQTVHGKKNNRTTQEIQYLSNKNAWIKLASAVFIEEKRLKLLKKNGNPLVTGIFPGPDLAIRNVLFNGLTQAGIVTEQKEAGYGVGREVYSTFSFNQQQRSGITGNNRAYGVGGTYEYGYSPMPGIIDADINDLNKGSIKKATLNVKAHNKSQFDVIDVLYLRLGFTVLLEWGNDKYLKRVNSSGNGVVENMGPTLIDTDFFKRNNSTYKKFLPLIEKKREEYNGNYDALFGVVSNFSWTFEPDGSYNIKLEIISQGDVIESLRANNPSSSTLATESQTGSTTKVAKVDKFVDEQVEKIGATSQDQFYDNLYPGLEDIITKWYTGKNFGFDVDSTRGVFSQLENNPPLLVDLQGSANQGLPNLNFSTYGEENKSVLEANFNIAAEEAFNKQLKIKYKNDIEALALGKKVIIKDFNFPPNNVLIEPTEGHPGLNGSLSGSDIGERQGAYWDTVRNLIGGDPDLLGNSEENIKGAKVVINNVSLTDFKKGIFENFRDRGLAGGSETYAKELEEGKKNVKEEEIDTQQAEEQAYQDKLENEKDVNSVYEYLTSIQQGGIDTTTLTLKRKDSEAKVMGNVVDPEGNAAYNMEENPDLVNFARLDLQELDKQYYIRLGLFLEFMEKVVCTDVESGGSSDPLLFIDRDIETNICYVIDNVISLDPTKMIVRNKGFFNTVNHEDIFPELEQFRTVRKGFQYGKLMNVYLNFSRVKSYFDNTTERNEVFFYDVLANIASDINESLGGINNIQITINKDTNQCRFIDQTNIPGLASFAGDLVNQEGFRPYKNYNNNKDEATLEVFGYNNNTSNFVRNIGITTEISKEYATIITIGATAQGAIPGAEAMAFSEWNVGLIDRFKTGIHGGAARNQATIEEQNESVRFNYGKLIAQEFLKLGLTPNAENKFDINSDLIKTIKSVVPNYYIYAQAESSKNPKTAVESSIGFIPFNLKIEMDGLSGVKIYNRVKVNTSFLPSNYGETLSFIVTGVNHKLSGNEWVTNLDTIATTKDKFSSK